MPETFKEYQTLTITTAIYPRDSALEYLGLGLASEAGEVAGKLKKVIRDNDGIVTELARNSLFQELGDVLWYISELCNELDLSLETVASYNISKLKSRQTRNMLGGEGDNR
jgi:NTP pyrophosphatase (non-canonical NTP hydrolase)